MKSHQLIALITECSPVKVATSQIGSDLVSCKAGSIVGDPTFINTIVGSVISHKTEEGEKNNNE